MLEHKLFCMSQYRGPDAPDGGYACDCNRISPAPSQAQRELARRALAALKAREGEDVHAWAYKLVEDVLRADD